MSAKRDIIQTLSEKLETDAGPYDVKLDEDLFELLDEQLDIISGGLSHKSIHFSNHDSTTPAP